jgi:hypothetical protein
MKKIITFFSAMFILSCENKTNENSNPQNTNRQDTIIIKDYLSSGDKNANINEIKLVKIDHSNSDDESNYVPNICNTIRYDDTYAVIAKITERIQDPQNENICELNYYNAPRLLINAEILAVAYGYEIPKNLQFSDIADWDWGNSVEKETEQLLFLNKINDEWFLVYAILLNPVDEENSFLSAEETDIPRSFEEYVLKIQEMRSNRIEYCNQDYYDEEYFYESMFNPYDENGACQER